MKVAIMQPYFFPYLGYFQLVNAVDIFIFLDDVNFIMRGWINRNRILINHSPSYLTVELIKASRNKIINDVEIIDNRAKLKKKIQIVYRKAPYFNQAWPTIENCLDFPTKKISELAIQSIKGVCDYLEIKPFFKLSSADFCESKGLEKTERLIRICKKSGADIYINPIGGQKLYRKEDFEREGIKLLFLKTRENISYKQFGSIFVPNLSIIDVLMFCPKNIIKVMLEQYDLL